MALKIAIQKSGRLYDESVDLLRKCGLKIQNSSGQLKAQISGYDAEVLFLRNSDIPKYLEDGVFNFLIAKNRKAKSIRTTLETGILASINLDGQGIARAETGLNFLDHMLDQISRHGGVDLFFEVDGDLEVDEHHTCEDVAIVLGELFYKALGKKAGITRYGFALPMDDCQAQVLLDFGGRSWLEWDVTFSREK